MARLSRFEVDLSLAARMAHAARAHAAALGAVVHRLWMSSSSSPFLPSLAGVFSSPNRSARARRAPPAAIVFMVALVDDQSGLSKSSPAMFLPLALTGEELVDLALCVAKAVQGRNRPLALIELRWLGGR